MTKLYISLSKIMFDICSIFNVEPAKLKIFNLLDELMQSTPTSFKQVNKQNIFYCKVFHDINL